MRNYQWGLHYAMATADTPSPGSLPVPTTPGIGVVILVHLGDRYSDPSAPQCSSTVTPVHPNAPVRRSQCTLEISTVIPVQPNALVR